LKVLKGVVKKKYDVLIIDEEGSDRIKYCIPEKYSSFVVEIRNSFPFVKSFSFLYSIFKGIKKSKGRASVSLLAAIILELRPKVVITFIDNNRFMGVLQTIFPDILVISVQNGARNESEFMVNLHDKYFSFPHYFGFGDKELKEMRSKGASVKKYYSNGSLNMGIFMSYFFNSKRESRSAKNICFISQYKQSFIDSDNIMYAKFVFLQIELCRLLNRFSQESNVNISIIMRSEIDSSTYQNELNFFKEIFDCTSVKICANNKKIMSSYQAGMDSDLIVAFNSTLLFELFGVGKKVLCFSDADREFAEVWNGGTAPANFTPEEILADSYEYQDFTKKVNTLLKFSDNDFFDKTQKSREYYMNFSNGYPHQVICTAIQRKCNQR